ncbi:MAG: two-component system, OmpR family, sensor histidine kinase SenX3 [Acidimicrobiaceae bacterium]|nr:two-component system, OmpR family, sensor histidine kinase SenX3 [Acidimicrobiaceae bacterium]
MSLTVTDQAIAGGAALVVLVTMFLVWRSRRALNRRLSAVVTRLERPAGAAGDGGGVDHGRGMERLLHRLERSADDAVTRVTEADAAVQRMTASLERVSDGVVVWDDHGHVVFQNGMAAALAGPEQGQALARQSLLDLRDAALAGEARTQGLDLFGPPMRTLVVTAAPLDDGWRTVGAVAVIHDVTDRRKLEQVRRDFVANVSYELKTPVGALALLAGSLAAEEDVVIARRLAVRMKEEAEGVGAVIDQLLDLGRVEAEERPVREPVPVGAMVAQALERVRAQAQRAGVRIEVADTGPQVDVMGDRRQLVTALGHLLDNAVKFSPAGGAVRLDAASEDEWVSVVVRDAGIGIAPRELDRVFERFYRGEAARQRTSGTGLGLSIVRHVASAHGGSVDVESTEGQGSVFTLRLPAAAHAVRWSA